MLAIKDIAREIVLIDTNRAKTDGEAEDISTVFRACLRLTCRTAIIQTVRTAI